MLALRQRQVPIQMMEKLGSMRAALERVDLNFRLTRYNIKNFTPRVRFEFERGNFLVKTVSSGTELEECLRLRFEVFHREYRNKTRTIGIDIDKYDFTCDHLAVFDKRTGKAIGTYRLNSSLHTDSFYSKSEFHLEEFLALEGNKLELGRSCIDRDYRNGAVISLLWRGIAEYIKRTDTRYLFGCASIKTMEPMDIGLITHHLAQKGHLLRKLGITPTRKYKVRQLEGILEYIDSHRFEYCEDEVQTLIPPLFQSYLKAGVKVFGEPALDRDFRCIDYLIILRTEDLSSLFKGKYQV